MRKQEPDCSRCLGIELLPDNIVTWNVFTVVVNQVIVAGTGTPIDVRHDAIENAMRRLEVSPQEQTKCFFMVIKLWHHVTECKGTEKDKKNVEPWKSGDALRRH